MSLSFMEMISAGERTLLVVDGLNLAFRYKHKGQTDFASDYIRTVRSLAQSYHASNIVIAADKGSSKFRREIYPEYKANREEKYKDQTPEEKEAFEAFFNGWEECLLMLEQEFPVLRFDKCEADDIAAYIVKHKSELGVDQIWLISSDRDWNLLVQPEVNQFSYVTRKELTYDTWKDSHECEPEEYLTLKVLQGDSGDNIKGIEGIGPKRALQLIQEYGDALDILEQLPISGKAKYIQSLNNQGPDLIERNIQLMDLLTFCEDALGEENCIKIGETIKCLLKS